MIYKLILFTFGLSYGIVYSQNILPIDIQKNFDDANIFFDEGRISEALTIYKTIENEGYVSGGLLFNIGVCYSYKDSLGLAKYYFTLAKEYPTVNEEAKNALTKLNQALPQIVANLPELPWYIWLRYLDQNFTSIGIFIFGIILSLLTAYVLILLWLEKIKKKMAWYLLVLSISVIIVSAVAFFIIENFHEKYRRGIVVASKINLYSMPDNESNIILNLLEGYELRVNIKNNVHKPDWFNINLSNGMSGWINKKHIRIIPHRMEISRY